MRWFCSKRWCDWRVAITPGVAVLVIATALHAEPLVTAPEPVIVLNSEGGAVSIYPRDIAAMDISESGGITDIFLRFTPDAARSVAVLTARSVGMRLSVAACGHVFRDAVVQSPVEGDSLYLPGTNAVRAEALRALWHGRHTCDTLQPGGLPDGD